MNSIFRLAVLFLLTSFTCAQTITGSGTANYIAKWSSNSNLTTSALCQSPSGGFIGVATCAPTQRVQVNSGNVLVKGANNFSAAGQAASYYVGDTNHALGATNGAGLFFSTYQQPLTVVIMDKTGFVGLNTTSPQARLHVHETATQSTTTGWTLSGTPLRVDLTNCGAFSGDQDFAPALIEVHSIDSGVDTTTAWIDCTGTFHGTNTVTQSVTANNIFTSGISVHSLVFSDGTVQTTAYKPAATALAQAAAIQQLQRDRDILVKTVHQLQLQLAAMQRGQSR